MGILYRSDLDRIQLNFFKEMANLRGTTVRFYETLSETKDIYTDIEVQSVQDYLEVDVLFEQYPQNRKTLQREGWYNKDADDNPDTAYVPLDLSILKRWQIVLIPGRVNAVDDGNYWRRYEVTKISTNMDHPHWYLIALAPKFTDNAPAIDRTENTNFINFNTITDFSDT